MRTVVLVVALGVVGCAKPQPESSLPVAVAEPAGVQPVEVAPAPREKWTDPRLPARMESHRNSDVRLLRALARGEIKAGDDIGPLIERHPECEVMRHGPWIDLRISHGRGGTSVIAKNGKLVCGGTASCIYDDQFFNTTTADEWTDHTHSYYARMHGWVAFRDSVPAVIGAPAVGFVPWRPKDR